MTMIGADSINDLQFIIDVIPNAIFVKDRSHRIILLNNGACQLFRNDRERILNSDIREFLPPEQADAIEAVDDRVFDTGQDVENEDHITDLKGETRTFITRKRLIHLQDGTPLIVAVATDVTAFRVAEAQNRFLAFHDPLTGLPNRTLLNERIDQALLRAQRRSDQHALLYIDLDRFKEVNDTYGHQAGDSLIHNFAARLLGLVRASDTICRLGGDEFAVLLTDMKDPGEVEQVCRRILEAAKEPFEVGGSQVFVSASIGVVFSRHGEEDRVELQRRADVALYQSKKNGRGCFCVFTDLLDQKIQRRQAIESELRRALVHHQGLEVHYQPLVSSADGKVAAMESLVRWNHPRLGMLQPDQFISIAEESGLIGPLGEWVLERSCQTLAPWPELGVAVNVSPVQLLDPEFADRVLAIIARTGVAPERLQLEITENAILNADDQIIGTLKALRRAGIKIALDDFGTGYSSLSHLRQFEVDKVKIDRSFVQHLGLVGDSAIIVQAVANLAATLGLSVVAEGVETDEQRLFLRQTGCTELQGFLVSRPLPEGEALAYLGAGGQAWQAA